MDRAFSQYHPAVNLSFFVGAVGFGMFFVHPAFLILSFFFSLSYYLLLTGLQGRKFLLGLALAFPLLSLLNPLLNPVGETVLFCWLHGRAFTLEALYYGLATSGMFCCVLLWFACYNLVMTSDKFLFLFGRMIPSISLVLSMVLRFVPHFERKVGSITGARQCIGKSPRASGKKEKLENSLEILSAFTSWALEGAVDTADSMKARGYGSGPRTSFAIYRLTRRDCIIGTIMLCAAAAVCISTVHGGASMVYLPAFLPPKANGYTALGLAGYGVFLSVPVITHIWEDAQWRILQSKI